MIKFLRLFAPVIFMLLVLIALVVAFNYPEQEVTKKVIDLPPIDLEQPVRSYGEYASDHLGVEG